MKFNQPNQEENKEKNNNNNQYNTKRTCTAALRSNRPNDQQNKTETKTQQHDEILRRTIKNHKEEP